MMPAGGLLVAAGLDWLEGLLPFLFVMIWIISQVMNLFRGAAKPPAGAPAAPAAPAPRAPRPVAGGGQVVGRDEQLDGEIKEFLRRTLDRAAQPQPVPPPVKPSRQRARRPAAPPAVPARGRDARPEVERGDVAGHVATAFAHDLAHASPDRTSVMAARAADVSPASELLAALRAPGGLRQLILMREVLERPTDRW